MSLDLLLQGFADAFSVENVVFLMLGVTLGTLVGLLPGIGPPTGLSLLLPLTLGMEPLTALIMLAGLYYGGMYGGSITSVLLNTPGDASQVMTTVEGYQLSRAGKAGSALAICAIASFVGGVVTLPVLMVALPTMSSIALSFGPPEYLALMLLALTGVASLGAHSSRLKGLAMAAVGVALSTIGMNPITGGERFTLGLAELYGGILLVPALIGLFAIGECASQLGRGQIVPMRTRFRDMVVTREELKRAGMPSIRASVCGFLIGVLPGVGATVAGYLSYDIERRISKRQHEFGSGSTEGLAAVDASNNASVNGAFLPTLTLGIPGSAATAILLGALLLHGIRPGPNFMTDQPDMAWGLLASFFLGNIALLVLNLPLAPVWALLLRIRYEFILPFVITASLIGSFAAENGMLGVWVAVAFGALGLMLKVLEFPLAPLIVGLVLGDMLEDAILQTSAMAFGDLTIVFERPIATALLALAVVFVLGPPGVKAVKKIRTSRRVLV